ncbi:polyketide cyclase/dehydrase/lipid transport protein [Marinimicrobium koreense]|uniref:Polyketide cyclase/dehydrase/lipid transport protein n=1 Tax=Marinimicrobium koreense TaxID=306545 RepID=A0A3N1P2F8_9GAMM|nr:SRPBCC family protein [Marinimicrobium koreense]ROQ21407.1 polyketide cyclase/dehydrase/lipid transport protein [Marinimicrobium koreense]
MNEYLNARPLRLALLGNAVFSFASAIVMFTTPGQVSTWLGVEIAGVLPWLAVGLALFAFDLVHQATRSRPASWRALYASAADLLWVVGTFPFVLVPGLLSSTGQWLVGAVAVVVLSLAVLQMRGIRHLHAVAGVNRYRHCLQVSVNSPAEAMWRVISNLGHIQNYVPMLKHSELMNGREPGKGAVRVCSDRSGKRWAEECIEFETGRSVTLRFLASEPDFPFPATQMTGGWDVEPSKDSPVQSQVTVWWELEPKKPWLAPLLLPMLGFGADRTFPAVVERMAFDARGGAPSPASQANGIVARLLPVLC